MAQGNVPVRRTFKFQLRPTSRQANTLTALLDDHRALYNAALQERRDAYRHPSKTTVRYGDQSAQLKDIRAFDPDHARWSFSSQQATLRRLDKAMAAFFRRVKSGEMAGYPRFKGANWFDTVEWPKDGDGCRWDSQPRSFTGSAPVPRPRTARPADRVSRPAAGGQTWVRLQGVGAPPPSSTPSRVTPPARSRSGAGRRARRGLTAERTVWCGH
jgi:hypothetical protein